MVHPTATNVPEEDITSSSALDSQTHHTSPEAAAWTPSMHPQCSEEGALHPSPPSCPISLPWPPGTSPPPRRRAGALTVSAALALPGASAPCGGTCLCSPLRPPRASLRARLRQPTRSPVLRDAPAAVGRSVCQSLRVSGKCFCSRLISSHSCGSVTRWQVSARARAPAWVCADPAPRTPQGRGGFPDPH